MEIVVTYDEEANASYLDLAPEYQGLRRRQVSATMEGANFDLILDLDLEGRILGIEIIGADNGLRQEFIAKVKSTS